MNGALPPSREPDTGRPRVPEYSPEVSPSDASHVTPTPATGYSPESWFRINFLWDELSNAGASFVDRVSGATRHRSSAERDQA